MTEQSNAKLLRIYIGELDKYKGKPLYEYIVLEAKQMGIAGASVFKGILSYGSASLIHTQKILALSVDLPILIEITDTHHKINSFIEVLNVVFEAAGCGGLITMENVEIIKYIPGAAKK